MSWRAQESPPPARAAITSGRSVTRRQRSTAASSRSSVETLVRCGACAPSRRESASRPEASTSLRCSSSSTTCRVCRSSSIVGTCAVAPEQLELAARDRERRQELVRGVVEERAPALDDELPLAHVPHHDEEDQRHQRDLGELGLTLRAHLDRTQREHEDGRHHGEQREHAVERVPHAQPVDDADADEDEVDGKRLPAVRDRHPDEVHDAEQP